VLAVGLFVSEVLIACEGVESADPPLEWKSGTASAAVTPKTSMLMAGYAARKEPSEGTEQDLYAKALAIEDTAGNRAVFLTLDLIGVTGRLRSVVTQQVEEKFKLPPRCVVINASHTQPIAVMTLSRISISLHRH
jgi:Neutral/alkaline non-lysosomal ceramidase, N-terminal